MRNLQIFILLIISHFLFCQTSKNSLIKVDYNEYRTFMPSIVNIDLGTLIASNEFSYYNSKPIKKINNSKSNNSEESIAVVNNKEELSEIVIDRKNKILTEKLYDNIFLKKRYAVYESLPKMQWKLFNDKKKIGNYECKKATTEFRGRQYEVWYTEKIPISLGPWKFNGLPGLILHAEDKEGIYKWEVNNISYPYDSKINLSDKNKKDTKYKKLSFEEYDELRINKIKEKIEIIKSRNSERSYKVHFEYSTEQEKEPINEFRQVKNFK